jgi:hypothetical protein
MPASKTYISVFATILMMILGCPVAGPAAADDLESRAEIGFRIAEQRGITLDRDKPAQGLGSYLVNASGCNDCHTWPNYALAAILSVGSLNRLTASVSWPAVVLSCFPPRLFALVT